MIGRFIVLSVSVLAAVGLESASAPAAASLHPRCESLTTLALRDTKISLAQFQPAGLFDPDGPRHPSAPVDLAVPICRVAGVIRPTPDSKIKFEVWMPASASDWNRKFLSAGEGAYAGVVNYDGISSAIRRGYAGGSTDTGHQEEAIFADWALGHPEKVIDFGYRAKHLQAARSKSIVRAFYGSEPRHSYFSSCSNGGRQGLMLAQRNPGDYDGIIVGAPAKNWTHNFAGFIWNEQALFNNPASYIPADKLPAIETATLQACDAIDGVVDDVVEDPRRCNFDPATLLCPRGVNPDSPNCLTAPQVRAVKKIMAGPHNPRTGDPISPGFFTGAAAEPSAWDFWITGPPDPGFSGQSFLGNGFFIFMVFEDPDWDFHTFDFDGDMAFTDAKLERVLNATQPNLRAFRERGGKIIVWQGWDDPAISPHNAVQYYNDVVGAQVGLQGNDLSFPDYVRGRQATDRFFRLFMVPGMLHCGEGPGPNAFGQNLPQTTPLRMDPSHDVLSALERWVEHDIPPAKIIAVKWVDDDPALGPARTRPLCPFPQVARYLGHGSTDEAANFACVDDPSG